MVRILIVLAVLAVVFVIISLVDCAMQPASRHRGVSKPLWIVIIAVLPVIGAVLWFIIGRGKGAGPAMRAPDDDPEFLRRVGMPSDQDERIRRLEEELAQLDAEDTDPRWGAHGSGAGAVSTSPKDESPATSDGAGDVNGLNTPNGAGGTSGGGPAAPTNSAPTPGTQPDSDGDEHRRLNG